MSQKEIDKLLTDLCVTYGFCISPNDMSNIHQNPPTNPKDFIDTVYVAEGMGCIVNIIKARKDDTEAYEKIRLGVVQKKSEDLLTKEIELYETVLNLIDNYFDQSTHSKP